MIYQNHFLVEQFEEYLKQTLGQFDTIPTLYVVQIGENFASDKYISYKMKKCEKLGIPFELIQLPDTLDEVSLKNYINSIPADNSGIIVQLPLPTHLEWIVDLIPYRADIDLLTKHKHIHLENGLLEPTIGAIDLVLKEMLGYEMVFPTVLTDLLDLTHKVVAVIGQGNLVGSPLLPYLKARNATIISINKDTLNPQILTQQADILITAAGVGNLVDEAWLKSDVIVIDAATLEQNGTQIGDVFAESLPETAYLCPSPGGIGPLTILCLLNNLLLLNRESWQIA
jgi:methylenetetrahydrofolate dehydrogenase (NADP+) / methenyltetrahydrofolate cyclohydrolase